MDVYRLSPDQVCAILQEGKVCGQRGSLAGYNATFLVEIEAGKSTVCPAVYKPQRGESHLWDFPTGTLYQREYLAYRVSQALGWAIVPPTVIRQGPHGIGSVQLYVRAEAGVHFFNLVERHKDAMVRIALFDCLINNADRKGGHVLRDADGRIWGIDHGLSFLAEPKLRTVMWDLSDEPVSRELKASIAAALKDDGLHGDLQAHLTSREVAALSERAACLLASSTIPMARLADSWRPYPWPPI